MSTSPKPVCWYLPGNNVEMRRLVETAIDAADLEVQIAVEADGIETWLLADVAIVDLTAASAPYLLGRREGARPGTTLVLEAANDEAERDPDAFADALAGELAELRRRTRGGGTGHPLLDLLGDGGSGIRRLKTDVFRDRVVLEADIAQRLAAAREARDSAAVAAVEESLGALAARPAATLVDLMLSYRAVSAWADMVAFIERLPPVLQRQVMVREQLAFALNRQAGAENRPELKTRALQLLAGIVAERGASSETCALQGRVHKDRWKEARAAGSDGAEALDAAIEAYRAGFLADWRDAFPGINTLTLLDIRGDEGSLGERDELLPIVRFAVERRLTGEPDYWDHATLLELAVLGSDRAAAQRHLDDAVAAVRERWEPETTAANLRLIRTARAGRSAAVGWLDEIIQRLASAA